MVSLVSSVVGVISDEATETFLFWNSGAFVFEDGLLDVLACVLSASAWAGSLVPVTVFSAGAANAFKRSSRVIESLLAGSAGSLFLAALSPVTISGGGTDDLVL